MIVVPLGQPEQAVQLVGVTAMVWLLLEQPISEAALRHELGAELGHVDLDLDALVTDSLGELERISLIERADESLTA